MRKIYSEISKNKLMGYEFDQRSNIEIFVIKILKFLEFE